MKAPVWIGLTLAALAAGDARAALIGAPTNPRDSIELMISEAGLVRFSFTIHDNGGSSQGIEVLNPRVDPNSNLAPPTFLLPFAVVTGDVKIVSTVLDTANPVSDLLRFYSQGNQYFVTLYSSSPTDDNEPPEPGNIADLGIPSLLTNVTQGDEVALQGFSLGFNLSQSFGLDYNANPGGPGTARYVVISDAPEPSGMVLLASAAFSSVLAAGVLRARACRAAAAR